MKSTNTNEKKYKVYGNMKMRKGRIMENERANTERRGCKRIYDNNKAKVRKHNKTEE